MKTLVIDVAAEYGGALTILNQFLSEFKNDKNNQYVIVLSTIEYEDSDNIKYEYYKWVKKSHLHRLFFDVFIVSKLVKKYRPDKIISLQNCAYHIKNIPQDVYFHNALPISEKQYTILESKKLWIYQQIIGRIIRRSLKYASTIIVQAEWIKKALISKWFIDGTKIKLKRPNIDSPQKIQIYNPKVLFYPANGNLYKNHITLIKALIPLWKKYKGPEIHFTGEIKKLPISCQKLLNDPKYPVKFLGTLSKDEMLEEYSSSILVFPSYIETIGLPLIEAKSLGSVIIASDCEYAREAVGNYKNISYFSSFNVNELTEIIENKCQQFYLIK